MEQIGAGYAMNTIDLSNKARFIAGVRVEETRDSVNNFSVGNFSCPPPETGTCSSITPNSFSGSYLTVLPSASLSYAVGSNDTLRFVYARGLSRPDPQDIAQALSWTVAGNGANRYSLSLGNASLKAETGDDLDVLFEHYLNSFGNVSAGYFYKFLQDPIISQTSVLDNYQPVGGPLSNYLATQPHQCVEAPVRGFEASYLQHPPRRCPDSWRAGLVGQLRLHGVRYNGHPGQSSDATGRSPNAFNISPTYDRGRVSIRAGLSYNQASIYGYQYTDGQPGAG